MNTALLYLPYLPNLVWFSNFLKHETVFIEGEERFVKSSFRNRCLIAGAQGVQILSIPIAGGRDHAQPYREVKISYHYNWQKKHWQSIRSAYGSTPFFEHYESRFEELYEKKFEFLFEFNAACLRVLIQLLKLQKEFGLTAEYQKQPTGIIDLRSIRSSEEQIHFPRYYQVFEERNGFLPNLSIIDVIFNLGPQAMNYLEDK